MFVVLYPWLIGLLLGVISLVALARVVFVTRRAMARKRLAKELGHAYQLKDVLDREAEEMGRMQSEPSKASKEKAERTARDAKDAAEGLKKIVEEKPGKDAFGPGLRKALSDKPLRELSSRLDDLARAIELLKSMPNEEERDRVAVYMNGLSAMRSEWRQGGRSATSPKPPPSSARPYGADRGRSDRSKPRERRGR